MEDKELELKNCPFCNTQPMERTDSYIPGAVACINGHTIPMLKNEWQKRNPEQGQIKLPEKNDEKDFPTLEEDSPELNKMLGWNACIDEIKRLNNV